MSSSDRMLRDYYERLVLPERIAALNEWPTERSAAGGNQRLKANRASAAAASSPRGWDGLRRSCRAHSASGPIARLVNRSNPSSNCGGRRLTRLSFPGGQEASRKPVAAVRCLAARVGRLSVLREDARAFDELAATTRPVAFISPRSIPPLRRERAELAKLFRNLKIDWAPRPPASSAVLRGCSIARSKRVAASQVASCFRRTNFLSAVREVSFGIRRAVKPRATGFCVAGPVPSTRKVRTAITKGLHMFRLFTALVVAVKPRQQPPGRIAPARRTRPPVMAGVPTARKVTSTASRSRTRSVRHAAGHESPADQVKKSGCGACEKA